MLARPRPIAKMALRAMARSPLYYEQEWIPTPLEANKKVAVPVGSWLE